MMRYHSFETKLEIRPTHFNLFHFGVFTSVWGTPKNEIETQTDRHKNQFFQRTQEDTSINGTIFPANVALRHDKRKVHIRDSIPLPYRRSIPLPQESEWAYGSMDVLNAPLPYECASVVNK